MDQLVNTIIVLMVNIIWLNESQYFNTQDTIQKRTEERCHLGRVIFLCSLKRFISKSLQDRKKLQINYTHKCSVWVIVRWTGASTRWNRIRLVVCRCGSVYIKNSILLIDTEEIGLLYMFPLVPSAPSISWFSKNRSDAVGGCS